MMCSYLLTSPALPPSLIKVEEVVGRTGFFPSFVQSEKAQSRISFSQSQAGGNVSELKEG